MLALLSCALGCLLAPLTKMLPPPPPLPPPPAQIFDVQKHWWGMRLVEEGFHALYMDSDNIVLGPLLKAFSSAWDVQGLSDWVDPELLPTGKCLLPPPALHLPPLLLAPLLLPPLAPLLLPPPPAAACAVAPALLLLLRLLALPLKRLAAAMLTPNRPAQ